MNKRENEKIIKEIEDMFKDIGVDVNIINMEVSNEEDRKENRKEEEREKEREEEVKKAVLMAISTDSENFVQSFCDVMNGIDTAVAFADALQLKSEFVKDANKVLGELSRKYKRICMKIEEK